MKLFGKKKAEKSCCCAKNCMSKTIQDTEIKKEKKGIKILGSCLLYTSRIPVIMPAVHGTRILPRPFLCHSL